MIVVTSDAPSPRDVFPAPATVDIGYMVHDAREVVAFLTSIALEPGDCQHLVAEPSGSIVGPFTPVS
jgi:hypothetical protein